MTESLTPELLLSAYARGYFPMAEDRDAAEIHWFAPEQRGVLPLDAFHIPKSLTKQIKSHPFTLTTDNAFAQVIEACAAREETWINGAIIDAYCKLHIMGFAHSVECRQDDKLVGGLYGVCLGGA